MYSLLLFNLLAQIAGPPARAAAHSGYVFHWSHGLVIVLAVAGFLALLWVFKRMRQGSSVATLPRASRTSSGTAVIAATLALQREQIMQERADTDRQAENAKRELIAMADFKLSRRLLDQLRGPTNATGSTPS